ncbi:MAG: matrixin family metalloprotease [Candidatus Melainabacteria bacterium]|nr:matrixin family metalloprotease [Candidatus Melainabacteria bacterium]
MRTFCKVVLVMMVCLLSNTGAVSAVDKQVEAFSHLKIRNFSKALDCFSAALKQHPKSWMLMQSIGNCHMELGHYDAAISELQKSIEVGGLHASQCNNLAAVYQRLGQPKKALSWLRLACSLDPQKTSDPMMVAAIKKLEDPVNNPTGSTTAPDYCASLVSIRSWRKNDLPLKVYIRRNPQIPAFYEEYASVVKDSLHQWCAATEGAVSYKIVDTKEAANLICDYTDRRELIDSAHELGIEASTESRVRMDANSIDWANIVVLVKDSPDATTFRSRAFLTKSCLHELGHALGMHGHSPSSQDMMFSAASVVGTPLLSQRDKNTIRRMYK